MTSVMVTHAPPEIQSRPVPVEFRLSMTYDFAGTSEQNGSIFMAADDDIHVTKAIRIPRSELVFQFSRSGGPGGQNVNKVNSRVQLRWNVRNTDCLRDEVRQRLITRARRRINSDGDLIITSQRYRDQPRNIDDCVTKLCELVRESAQKPAVRKTTRPSAGAKKRRLQSKKERSQRKQARRPPKIDD